MDGDLRKTAQDAMNIRPNFAYTAKEVQEDVQRVFACGYFAKLTPIAEDTRDGVKLTMEVCHSSSVSSAEQSVDHRQGPRAKDSIPLISLLSNAVTPASRLGRFSSSRLGPWSAARDTSSQPHWRGELQAA